MSLLSARGISKAYGTRTLFRGVELTIEEGDRVGLLGINGTGKSTLLRVLSGEEPPDEGVLDRRRGARMLTLTQEPVLEPTATPRGIVAETLSDWQREAGEGGEHLALEMLARLGIRDVDRPVGTMSGGERRRVALARVLVAAPDLAVLDEPTNHLDADTIEWLEEHLTSRFRGAVLVVTHDRYVLDAVATRVVELDEGRVLEFKGNYTDYLEQKAELIAHGDRVEQNRLNLIRRERAWLMRGAKARSTKQKARIQRAESVIAEQANAPRARGDAEMGGLAAARLGGTILELRDVGVSQGDRTLFDGLTLHVVAGDRIGVVGPNGAGKTSLLKVLAGEAEPTRGRIVFGVRTEVAYFDQARAQLVDAWSVIDNVAGQERGETQDLRTYLEKFLFDANKWRQKVGSLSGGERARVALAKMLRTGANVLLLDEPTNDLDVGTLAALEEALLTYPGCVVAVSHDRAFLNGVATSILAFDGEGGLSRYPGNWDAYREKLVADKAARAEAERGPRRSEPPRKAEPKPKGLTYAERLELETIFDRIGEAENAVAKLEAALADPAVYASGDAVKETQTALEAARAALAAITERWEGLEARKANAGQ